MSDEPTTQQETIIAVCLMPFLMVLVGVPIIFYQALWYRPLWEWFMVPLGLPSIGFWHLAGLMLLVLKAFNTEISLKSKFQEETWKRVLYLAIFAPVTTLIGWIIHSWLM